MTSSELCRYLNINPRTFRRWLASGEAPPPKERTACGYGLWSPAQQQALMRKKARVK